MPIELDLDELESSEGGKGLRAKLEEVLEQNRKLETANQDLAARNVLADPKFSLVKPEDLVGVPLDKIGERAEQFQAERSTLQNDLLRSALEARGFQGEELEDMVLKATGQSAAEVETARAVNRARSLGTVDSTTVPLTDNSKLHGKDAIHAALEPKGK